MDPETSFWENYKAQNITFQETNLLNIVNHYVNSSFNNNAYQISTLSDKAYIQELITIAYL